MTVVFVRRWDFKKDWNIGVIDVLRQRLRYFRTVRSSGNDIKPLSASLLEEI